MRNIDFDNISQYDNPYDLLKQMAKNQLELQKYLNTLSSTMLEILKKHQTTQQALFEVAMRQQNLLQTYANIPDTELVDLDLQLFLLSEQVKKP